MSSPVGMLQVWLLFSGTRADRFPCLWTSSSWISMFLQQRDCLIEEATGHQRRKVELDAKKAVPS